MTIKTGVTTFLGFVCFCVGVNAQPAPPQRVHVHTGEPLQLPATDEEITNAVPRMIAPGVLAIGRTRVNKEERSVTFPARLNMLQGPVEYLLVSQPGKVHESVLVTDVEPYHIHVAMLLLNVRGSGKDVLNGAPAGRVTNPAGYTVTGDEISISVKWKSDRKEIILPGEGLLWNGARQTAMTNGQWVYNGSRMWEGRFLGQMTGSIVSLITDGDALVNSIAEGHDNDEIWSINTNAIPAAGTQLQVTFKLKPASANATAKRE